MNQHVLGIAGAHAGSITERDSEIIYQVYPRTFADADGDGYGDLRGIIEHLNYIKSLHVDAIWISPIFLSPPGPDGDGGYAVTDYRRLDPHYGDLDSFQELLDRAHAQGLRVYLDFIPGHTAHDHEWFLQSRQRVDPYTSYYVWHNGYEDEQHNRIPPNNWKSVFGGPAWTLDPERGQWYLHHFLPSQPALNLNEQNAQQAVLGEIKYWLDMGVDGLRYDSVPFWNYDPELHHNPWRDGQWPRGSENWWEQRFEHSMWPQSTADFIGQIRVLHDSYPDRKTAFGEAIAGREGGCESIHLASEFVNVTRGLHAVYTDILLTHAYPSHEHINWTIDKIANDFSGSRHINPTGNHDFSRFFTRMTNGVPDAYRERAVRQVMTLLMTMPGPFCLYMGDELGLENARIPEDIPDDRIKDPIATRLGIGWSRDGARTPFPFREKALNAGFTTADVAYLPVPSSHYSKAADLQEADPKSMLKFVQREIGWRRNQPALLHGEIIPLNAEKPVIAFMRRSAGEQTLLSLFNLSGEKCSFLPSDHIREDFLEELGINSDLSIEIGPYGSAFRGEMGPKALVSPLSRADNLGPRELVAVQEPRHAIALTL